MFVVGDCVFGSILTLRLDTETVEHDTGSRHTKRGKVVFVDLAGEIVCISWSLHTVTVSTASC